MNTFVCKCEFLCSGGSCNEEVGEARIDLQCTSSMNVYKCDSGLILPPPCRLHAASPSVFVSPSPSLTFSQLPKHTEYTYNCFLTPWSLRLSCSCEYISMTLSLSLYGASSVSTFELTSTDIRTPVAIVLDISVNVNVVYRCRMERARTHPRHPFFNQHRHHQTRPTSISASFRQFTQLKWPNTSKSTSTSSSIDRSIDSTSINECWPPQPPPRSLCHSSLVSIHTIIVIISFINIMKWRRKQ